MKKLLMVTCMAGVLLSPSMVYGQEDATTPETAETQIDVADTVYDIVTDIRKGDWRHAAVGVLLILMLALRKFRRKLKVFDGDRGGAVLVMLLSLGGAFATTLATDMPVDLKMVLSTMAVAFTAVGGYTWVKKMIWPKD